MASGTRSTRRTMATEEDSIPSPSLHPQDSSTHLNLSILECLILAQAVYEHGANDWHSVSKILSKHPSVTRPTNFFSPQSCHQLYTRLMSDASLECSEANNVPHGEHHRHSLYTTSDPAATTAPLNLRLAQHHYSARLLQLRDFIAAEEVKFKRIIAEIDEIRSGAWDDRIRVNLAHKDEPVIDLAEAQPPPIQPLADAQDNIEQELGAAHEQNPSTQPSESGDMEAEGLDESAEQLTVEESTLEPSLDEAVDGIPPADEVVHQSPEPFPEDITEVSSKEPIVDEDMGANTRAFETQETAQMEVDEPATTQEPEPAVNQEAQQRDGMSMSTSYLCPVSTPSPTGKRKASDSEGPDDGLRDKKRPREESTSTDVDESGPAIGSSSRRRGTTSIEPTSLQQVPPSVPNKRFQTVIGMLHSQISQHRNGNIFHNPIKNSEAPDYHEIIKRPMDLKTIKARVKDGIISGSLEFQRDVYLMFANAMMYNRPGSDIYQMAEEMMIESEVHINTFRQTEGFVRSTRS
ncbi:hypothetical protein BU15DRAFT_69923 [Melanogaster broomeanus]|nr:hypothetical protein BU15DRAFT_69923 [Melanogaster broomeanus]